MKRLIAETARRSAAPLSAARVQLAGAVIPARGLSFVPKANKAPIYEPEHGVVDEDAHEVHPSEVRVPFVSERMKQEIYAKFKALPEDSMVTKLAQDYRMDLTRMKATIYLMKTREEMMAANRVLDIPKEDEEIYQLWKQSEQRAAEIKQLKEQVAEKKAWEEKHKGKRMMRAKKKKAADPLSLLNDDEKVAKPQEEEEEEGDIEVKLAQLEAMTVWTPEALAAEKKRDLADVKDVIKRLDEHSIRMYNLENHEAEMEDLMSELRENGVNTHFAETTIENNEDFDYGYVPRLLQDHELEKEAKAQRLRLLLKTKAQYAPHVENILAKKYTDNTGWSDKEKQVPNNAGVKTDYFTRSKFAFLDTSSQFTREGATLIKKRDGGSRLATPLEEMNRSWGGRKPNYLELVFHEKLLEIQMDPDKDEAKARQMVIDQYAARQKALGDAKGKK